MGLSQFDEAYPVNFDADIDNAFGTGMRQIVGNYGAQIRIDVLNAINSDVVDHVVTVHYTPDSGTDHDLGSVNVPAGSGYAGLPPVDLLDALVPQQHFFLLKQLDVLRAGVDVAVTAGTIVNVYALGGTL